jgi:hypothetical protein
MFKMSGKAFSLLVCYFPSEEVVRKFLPQTEHFLNASKKRRAKAKNWQLCARSQVGQSSRDGVEFCPPVQTSDQQKNLSTTAG